MGIAAVHVDGRKICDGLIVEKTTVAEVRKVAEALGASVSFARAPNVVLIQSRPAQDGGAESWERLAERMGALASMTDEEISLLCATVEAETGGNNLLIEWDDDAVGGVGFGQVWPRWHHATILQAAGMLGYVLPPGLQGDTSLQAALLVNREISMLTVTLLVRDWWRQAGGDFATFTRAYVGDGITDEDLRRRQLIWDRWRIGRVLPR